MITRFSSLYAGHVDLPDMGQTATPANERRHSNEHLATVFEKTDAVAKVMRTMVSDCRKVALKPSNGASMPFSKPLPNVVSRMTSGSLMPV